MRLFFTCLFLLISCIPHALAEEKHKACIADAMDKHLELSIRLLKMDAATLLSPQVIILKRRAYENYCLEVMDCGLQNYKRVNQNLIAGALFRQCLDDEHNN